MHLVLLFIYVTVRLKQSDHVYPQLISISTVPETDSSLIYRSIIVSFAIELNLISINQMSFKPYIPSGWKQAVSVSPHTSGFLVSSEGIKMILTICAGLPDGVENSTSDGASGSLITRRGCKMTYTGVTVDMTEKENNRSFSYVAL